MRSYLDRNTFGETFDKALAQGLQNSFQELIETRIAYYNRLIRFLTGLREKNDDMNPRKELHHFFSKIYHNSDDQLTNDFSRSYIQGLDEAIATLPEEVVWSRKMKLRREVQHILADPKMIIELLREFKRRQLQFFISLEHALAEQVKSGKQEGSSLNLSPLITELEQQVNFLESSFRQKLDRSIERIQSSVQIGIEKKAIKKRAKASDPEQTEERWQVLRQSLFNEEKRWEEPKKLLFERSKNILDFLKLKTDIQKKSRGFLEDFGTSFKKNISTPLLEFRRLLKETSTEINQIEIYDSRNKIKEVRRQLLTTVEKKLEGPMHRLTEERILARQAEQFYERTLMRISQAPEQMGFVFNLNDDQEPLSEDDIKQIEWRLLLARIFREQLINRIKPNNRKYDNFLSEAIREVQEIRDILDVNFVAALQNPANSGEKKKVTVQVAIEALDRVRKRTDALILNVQQEFDEIETDVKNGEHKFFEAVITCFKADSVKELQLFIAKYKVRETTRDWQDAVDSKTRKSKDRLKVWYRLYRRKGVGYRKNIKAFFGYGKVEDTESNRADIISYLSETDQKLQELPYIYRQLFDFDTAVDSRFYIPVIDSSATFKRTYEQWNAKLSVAFAVVGEKGSGKSTFLRLMTDELSGDESLDQLTVEQTIKSEEELLGFLSRELNLKQPKSTEAMIEALKNEEDRRIIFLESIQNCFVRNINGYEAIEKLCYLISETKDHIFWVVSCSRYGWHFLSEVFSLSEYFSHMIRTDTLDTSEIQKVIMNRHRASGYTLHFERKQEVDKRRRSEKLTEGEEQKNLKEDYFENLAEIADGNASIAMLFWIRSILSFDDICFYIKPLEVTSLEMIEDLNPEVLFTLASFVQHDTLAEDDLSMILNLNPEESRLMLNRLHSRGLLLKDGEYYFLNHLMYRQIVRVLRDRNIIHLV